MSAGFVHLHNHMEGSYNDSALQAAAALDKVKALGMTSFALTDHGEMAMVPEFMRLAEDRGLQPIVGVEAYFVENASENIRNRVNDRHHLLLLAENETGFRNIVTMISSSWRDNCLMQKLGLIDWNLLNKHSEGVICLSGCLAGPLAWSYHKSDPAKADVFYGQFHELFQKRFFVEVFDHGMPEEKVARDGMMDLAKRYNARVVLTNDCHYLGAGDWILHDVLIKTRFGRPTDFALPYHEYFIKSEAEMRGLGFPGAFCDATVEIAAMISLSSKEIFSGSTSGDSEAAFLGIREIIGRQKAIEKAASVMGLSRKEQDRAGSLPDSTLAREHPELFTLAGRLQSLPGQCRPDLERIVVLPNLASRIPLRRMETIMFTMWDETACLRAGAEIQPVERVPALAIPAAAVRSYQQGMAAFRRRKLDKARECFLDAIEQEPKYANAIYQYGIVEYYIRDYAAAIEAFGDVLRLEPEFERLPHLQSYVGWCHYDMGEYLEGSKSFESSIAMKKIPGSYLGAGLCFEKLGDPRTAEARLLEFVEMAPDHSQIAMAQESLERLTAAARPA